MNERDIQEDSYSPNEPKSSKEATVQAVTCNI